MESPLSPARILLPREGAERTWSVIACDQFTSDRTYWERVERTVGDSPSALRLILPEAYLEERDPDAAAGDCAGARLSQSTQFYQETSDKVQAT